ncbi:hypothetical protein FH972_020370 [Carpinus fangiana]|uniref:Cytochrome P450 n=1 Tax=Carpinus fangiana TaxID=176857 RepID=A0A5N6RUK9_9ROSI|nr:hypothetical protein FH972_020370 [Carpinus fangiana]
MTRRKNQKLSVEDHKRVRGALVSFLKPESLKLYVGKMDGEVKEHLEMHWHGKPQVEMKIVCIAFFFNEEVLTEDEIVHNVMLIMVAGHDTSSVLMTFIMRLLANEPAVYAAVLQEQEEMAKTKLSGEFLTWEDLTKMKYTWRVAMETLRMVPPAFGGFRKALKDIEYGGYLIPKGWQAIPMTHMDGSIFLEPSKFGLSRFENQTSIPPYSFVAFGAGPRICPGYEFARIKTLVTIHYLVTQFAWKLCTDNFFSRDPMPIPTQGLPIKLVPRKLC